MKHQILLPKNHHITNVIIWHYHKSNLHAAPELLYCLSRQKFWIIQSRSKVKSIYKRCVRCATYNATPSTPKMGNLPEHRIQSTRPFLNTGVDLYGPLNLKPASKLRYRTTYKAYVSLFICMSTKAIHIEIVTDLSAESFLSSLKRFTSRRGKPANIYSDNGTNFVDANRILDDEFKRALNSNQQEIRAKAAEMSID